MPFGTSTFLLLSRIKNFFGLFFGLVGYLAGIEFDENHGVIVIRNVYATHENPSSIIACGRRREIGSPFCNAVENAELINV